MPNGDNITADFQWQLGETVYGAGTNNTHLEAMKSIDGLGVLDAKTQDVVWNLKDGSYGNPDYMQPRVISIPAIIKASTEVAVMTSFKALTLDWVPQLGDIDLAFRLPGWGVFYVLGRPRGLKPDLTHQRRGVVRALLRFDALDPTITYVP